MMNPAVAPDARILVLEAEDHLAASIVDALREVAPNAVIDVARSLEDAQRMAGGSKPDLFVLDVDASYDLAQEFLYDLRTSHPDARAIILTGVHLAAARERVAGLGAIHFLEKPFPHSDFVDLVQALLRPAASTEDEKFQGTLSDLHIADIIQLKCMSGATSAIEFTAPNGDKARVYFENGQIRHATAAGKEGLDAFNELMSWKGGKISEIATENPPHTIEGDWQLLLMEGMRTVDEAGAAATHRSGKASARRHVLVVDDSLMLLSFVRDILTGANYEVASAPTASDGLKLAAKNTPELILLDYILPDMKGDEVARQLRDNPATSQARILYMSGLGTDLHPDTASQPNVIGVLNKPFTSDLLIKTVETHMPKTQDDADAAVQESAVASGAEPTETPFVSGEPFLEEAPAAAQPAREPGNTSAPPETETTSAIEPAAAAPAPAPDEWWSAPHTQADWVQPPGHSADVAAAQTTPAADEAQLPTEAVTHGAYFCGDTRFFSLNWALQTIGKEKLTGRLRLFWTREPVDLLAQDGAVVLVTTLDSDLYCSEAPITLVNVDQQRVEAARVEQRATGCPMFLTLAQEQLILREPAVQLVQHYGQKLFAQLWSARRVRFVFEHTPLPDYAHDVAAESDLDNWALGTLRSIQLQDLDAAGEYDPACIPAYTKDGFERIQNLKLTVAEAQFASQFNGARSFQQIAKNLRLDIKFARVTLFRFLALDIVECWPPTVAAKPERKGVFQRILGIGE
jgi:DNA-binding response OmpR family regulator